MGMRKGVREAFTRVSTRSSGRFGFLPAAPHPLVSRPPEWRWLSEEEER